MRARKAQAPLLRRALWGPWFYKPKARKIVSGAAVAAAAKGRNMAVSFMLERVWAVYAAFQLGEVPEGDREELVVLDVTAGVIDMGTSAFLARRRLQLTASMWPWHAAASMCRAACCAWPARRAA
jgi:hypothetical protein